MTSRKPPRFGEAGKQGSEMGATSRTQRDSLPLSPTEIAALEVGDHSFSGEHYALLGRPRASNTLE